MEARPRRAGAGQNDGDVVDDRGQQLAENPADSAGGGFAESGSQDQAASLFAADSWRALYHS